MKKLAYFLGIIILLFNFSISNVNASNDCPYGNTDSCPAPCASYIDLNADGECDHLALNNEENKDIIKDENYYEDLISGKDIKNETVKSVAELYNISAEKLANSISEYLGHNIKITDDFQLLHDNYGLEPSITKELATNIALNKTTDYESLKTEKENEKTTDHYYTFLISAIVILLYLFSYLLYKFKKISLYTHRKIWNYILTFVFIGSAILGILLAIRHDNGKTMPLPFNIVYWHVILGIIATVISIFHIAWHWRYYLPRKTNK